MRLLSEDIRILLKARDGESQPGDAARHMIFQ